jgi:hypothetical protein
LRCHAFIQITAHYLGNRPALHQNIVTLGRLENHAATQYIKRVRESGVFGMAFKPLNCGFF